MGREVRPVALDWEHPRKPGTYLDGSPRYLPLYSRADLRRDIRWNDDHPDDEPMEIDLADYMPEIPEGTPLGWQLYETTSEGTPVSPVLATLEELAAWCETGATVFADYRWTREQWLRSFKDDSTDVHSLLLLDGTGMHVGDPLKESTP